MTFHDMPDSHDLRPTRTEARQDAQDVRYERLKDEADAKEGEFYLQAEDGLADMLDVCGQELYDTHPDEAIRLAINSACPGAFGRDENGQQALDIQVVSRFMRTWLLRDAESRKQNWVLDQLEYTL